MIFTEGEKEPFMPAYVHEYDPLISYAIGNRSIGLLFGQRVRASMLWKVQGYVRNSIVMIDDSGTEHLLTSIPNVKELTFGFDFMSFPILAVELEDGVHVYKFDSIGGDVGHRTSLTFIPGARNPKLVPTNISDLGSVLNQPALLFVDDAGDVVMRSYEDSFGTDKSTILYNLMPTDELREAGITRTGKIQVEISKIKLKA